MLERRDGQAARESARQRPRARSSSSAPTPATSTRCKILDLLYLSDFVDPYYKRNREQLTVVGYGCFPDDKCFCRSQGTANVDDGFDLFLTPLEGRFLVTIATRARRRHRARQPEPVRAGHAQDVQEYLERA